MISLLIGVDCATDESKVGLACAAYRSGAVELIDVSKGAMNDSCLSTLSGWLVGMRRATIAFDAPLGWPIDLAASLASHRAGELIAVEPNRMFRRETDRFVQRTIKKTPLDVGADRIARTAHAALTFLDQLRAQTQLDIPLAWSNATEGVTAIEVYPAATLKGHGFRSRGYKKPAQVVERDEIITSLATEMDLRQHSSALRTNPDVLDAVVCVLSARDFLNGQCARPVDQELASREGWIWVKSPGLES